MVKLDYDRDYYADLELPPTADATEVKKQFKKLALLWHPDRNPGREDAAKEKFLVIQAAHEILSDPVTKSKFDAYRQRTARYPAASGVKGNPWQYTAQEVNQRYGAPPKRPPMPTRPAAPTATSTHWSWARNPPQSAKSKMENARASTEAWNRARPVPKPPQPSTASAGGTTRSSQPREPPPTPRTAAQARRQEAAFGTRRTGYAPASPVGDEPPVKNQHYNTSASTNPGASTAQPSKPRPTSAFPDPYPTSFEFSETFLDSRQRTPYAANVGEKTNPFEPLNVNRAKSMRDGTKKSYEAPPPPPPRPRSASVGSDNFKRSTNDKPAFNQSGANPSSQFQSRASARYSPRGSETNSAPQTATFPAVDPGSSSSSVNSNANATVNGDASEQTKNGAKVYEHPFPSYYRKSGGVGVGSTQGKKFDFPAYKCEESVSPSPSGEAPSVGANAFEAKLQAQLQHLLCKARPQPHQQPVRSVPSSNLSPGKSGYRVSTHANSTRPDSFSVPLDDIPITPDQQARFTRNSADNINTRFVAEEKGGASFQFSAGAATSTDDSFLRAKRAARGGRQSPLRNEFTASSESSTGTQQPEPGKKQSDFVPEQWKEAFGPHIFEPQQTNKPSISPTRPMRPIKKPRPVRMTAGTAGLVDEEETISEDKAKASRRSSSINGSRSPNAMDVDSPPPEPATAQTSNGPRNINVEPTNPQWRAGNVNGASTEPKLGAGLKIPNLKPNAAGSEDSEEFIVNSMLHDIRKVEPFAQKATGLNSFADLGANLPFPSRPSAKIPVAHEKPKQLDIPSPPTAPRPPASLCIPSSKPDTPAWQTYVREFEAYMAQWFKFNRLMTDHFAARQKVHENGGLAWLNARGDAGVQEYLRTLEEDKTVRQRWMAACEQHELHFREFMECRERVAGN
ncbi:hypothetical protein C8A03DRAFT_31515 [Achaetomium macrosporum]|uniref:J domain-containing protein n=1 Tax=Achaetomium macrosporum TaxID=79813 RepID=A0AAN7HH87_9PEZI|nr:hypothetical protein C8A03DRAFT_31515 [Achaetomium macrosporum]